MVEIRYMDDAERRGDPRGMRERSAADPTSFYPTNTCYDDSLDFIVETLRRSGREACLRLTLVHGVVHIQDHAIPHAWVEDDEGHVIETYWYRGEKVAAFLDRVEYHAEMGVVDQCRYDVATASRLNEEHDNFGPWEPRYIRMLDERDRA